MLPLVLIPGIQGRWEFMRPTVDALSAHFRVLTFSLRDDARSLDDYAAQAIDLLDRNGTDRAVICGVSFGGLVAVRVAATHPRRTRALVLASTPAPGWTLPPRHRLYARLPWIFGPLFLVESPFRLRAEIAAAFPDRRERSAFRRLAIKTARGARISLSRMASRALLMAETDVRSDCSRVTAPTLVVTGERDLDRVVPVAGSSEYTRLIAGARAAVIERTGHVGTITRPQVFAEIVRDFVARRVRLQPDQVA
jgi:pimeloyl-ACP methyl ester carboxylesterase